MSDPKYLDPEILRALLAGPAPDGATGSLWDHLQARLQEAHAAVAAAQEVLSTSPFRGMILQTTGATDLWMEDGRCLLVGVSPTPAHKAPRRAAAPGARPIDLLRAEAARLGIPTEGVSKRALRLAVEAKKAKATAAREVPETSQPKVVPDPSPMPVLPPPPRKAPSAPTTVVQMQPDQVSTTEDTLSMIFAGISEETSSREDEGEDGVTVEYEEAPANLPSVRAPRLGTALGKTSRRQSLKDVVASAVDYENGDESPALANLPPPPF